MGETGRPIEHGAYALLERGTSALTLDQAAQMAEIAHQLHDSHGVEAAIRQQAALALVLSRIVAEHIESEAAAGTPLDEIPVLRTMPAFLNTSGRLLAQLRDILPKVGDARSAELERIRAAVEVPPAPTGAKEADYE